MQRIILILIVLVFLTVHCRRKDKSVDTAEFSPDNVAAYTEGDTLQVDLLPNQIKEWVRFYSKWDTSFTFRRFKASGVNLHLNELPDAISKGNEQLFESTLFFAPDRSKYIDLFSYNCILDNGKYVMGEIDQQVVLGDRNQHSKKQLMYFGPSQLAESAGWFNNHSFIVAITERMENRKIKAELLLFNLEDSLYTNFQLDHLIASEAFLNEAKNFPENYLNKLNF